MSNFFNKTPYTDFHELNLDWLLERVNNIKEHVKGMQDDIIYLQEHTPDMDDYYDRTETDALLANKADVSDLPDMTDYYDKNETDALLADKADVSDLPDMTDYYDKTETDALLADKANVSSLAAVATSGDFNDLINKGSWSTPSANGWNYYTDPFGYRHWFRRSIPYTLNFNISQGGVYLTDVDTWTLNTDISKLIFADIHCECNDRLVTGQIQGFTSTQLKTFYYAQTSGTSSVVVNLHLVFRP